MSPGRPLKVLIVDDSATARVALRGAFAGDSGITVVGEAAHGKSALELVKRLNPDLVTMDMYLKGHNGLDITREIMHAAPRPIVMVTAVNPKDPSLVYEALSAGVLEVLGKLPAPTDPAYSVKRQELLRAVRSLSRVPVVRRRFVRSRKRFDAARALETPASGAAPARAPSLAPRADFDPQVILLGASTGGPPVVCELLKRLPPRLGIPVVVVQHLAAGFTAGFAAWLQTETKRSVTVVKRRTQLELGGVYVAGEGSHLKLVAPWQVTCSEGEEVSFHRPSIDVLFHSAARHFGGHTLAILCSGMGSDGAAGMRALFDAGAWTIVQSPATCAVDSMPKRAMALGGVCCALTPEEISAELTKLPCVGLPQ